MVAPSLIPIKAGDWIKPTGAQARGKTIPLLGDDRRTAIYGIAADMVYLPAPQAGVLPGDARSTAVCGCIAGRCRPRARGATDHGSKMTDRGLLPWLADYAADRARLKMAFSRYHLQQITQIDKFDVCPSVDDFDQESLSTGTRHIAVFRR